MASSGKPQPENGSPHNLIFWPSGNGPRSVLNGSRRCWFLFSPQLSDQIQLLWCRGSLLAEPCFRCDGSYSFRCNIKNHLTMRIRDKHSAWRNAPHRAIRRTGEKLDVLPAAPSAGQRNIRSEHRLLSDRRLGRAFPTNCLMQQDCDGGVYAHRRHEARKMLARSIQV